jgi:hypothetical protein
MPKNAPVRVPGDRMLPSEKIVRVDTSESSEIIRALRDGGCTRSADDLSIILDLSNRIEWALRFYISDRCFRMAPPAFRNELRKFTRWLSAFADSFPSAGSVLERALKEQLARDEDRYREASRTFADEIHGPMMCDPSVFMERMRKGLDLLRLVAGEIAAEESGRGRDNDRDDDELVKTLSGIWRDFTGKEPGQGGDPYEEGYRSPFERFLYAACSALPAGFPRPKPRYRTRKINSEKSSRKT